MIRPEHPPVQTVFLVVSHTPGYTSVSVCSTRERAETMAQRITNAEVGKSAKEVKWSELADYTGGFQEVLILSRDLDEVDADIVC